MSDQRSQISPRAPIGRQNVYSDRAVVWLIKVAVRRPWLGAILIVLLGAAFITIDALFYSPSGGMVTLAVACLGLLLALFRRSLKKLPSREWHDLDAIGRFDRIVLTMVGTAMFAAPVAWVLWWMLSPR